MKKCQLLLITLCLSAASFAQINEKNPSTEAGAVYGTSFKVKKPISTEALHKKLNTPGKKVDMQVKGEVVDVCPKKGCWMNVRLEDSSHIFIKMKDYAFFVPMQGLQGKSVVLEGQGYKEVFSVEELQHYAEDAKKSKEEIEAITQPEEKLRFTATGIQVLQ